MTCAIDGDGNITVTATDLGPTAKVFIADGNLFKNTSGELRLATPVVGDGQTYTLTVDSDVTGGPTTYLLSGDQCATFDDLAAHIIAQDAAALFAEIVDGEFRVATPTVGGDETSNGFMKILPVGVFEHTTGFKGYGIPKPGADSLIDSLFLAEGVSGDSVFKQVHVVGRPPKPLVSTGVNQTTDVYYNGSAWVRVIDDTPV
jgi:hypothetical protein